MFEALVCLRPTKQRHHKQPQLRQRSKRKKRVKHDVSKRKDTTDEKQACNDEEETVAAGVSYISGELQLFRQHEIMPDDASGTCTMLCLLSIPPEMSLCAISQFIGLTLPSSSAFDVLLSALRIENPRTHQVSLVLVFSRSKAAYDCFLRCNGRAFDTLRQTCYVLRLSSFRLLPIGYGAVGSVPVAVAPAAAVCLPSCPMCLERLDTSASGLTPLLCEHDFIVNGCRCVSSWESLACAVCSALRRSRLDRRAFACEECGTRASDLWVCLLCAHVGCNRFHNSHAVEHFASTQHRYSVHLSRCYVWDYEGDGYSHRLLQGAADCTDTGNEAVDDARTSSVVVFKESTLGACSMDVVVPAATVDDDCGRQDMLDAKLHSLTEHYNKLLAAQLQAQSAHFENEMQREQNALEKELGDAEQRRREAAMCADAGRQELLELRRRTKINERRAAQARNKISQLQKESSFAQHLNESLRHDQLQCAEGEQKVVSLSLEQQRKKRQQQQKLDSINSRIAITRKQVDDLMLRIAHDDDVVDKDSTDNSTSTAAVV